MSTPPATRPGAADQVLRLLADGVTTVRTAELTGWPRTQVLALIRRTEGWLHDPTRDVVTMPGHWEVTLPSARPRPRAAAPAPPPGAAAAVQEVPVCEVEPNPHNPRRHLGDIDELAASIRTHGILQPPVVEPHPTRTGGYRLLAGHRRLAAAQAAGLTHVPVIVRDKTGVAGGVEVALIENSMRTGLSPMEKAVAFGQLRDLGLTQERIAGRTGFAATTVGYYLTLLELDDSSQERVRSGVLSASDAVQGIRRVRDRRKKRGGSHRAATWEPDHLGDAHPLATRAQKLCEGRGHGMRRWLGAVACGQCWEAVIRLDERRVVEAEDAEGQP